MKRICEYAATNPLESVACDLAKRGINSIDKESLLPKNNLLKSSPYEKKIFLAQVKASEINKMLKQVWNGKLIT